MSWGAVVLLEILMGATPTRPETGCTPPVRTVRDETSVQPERSPKGGVEGPAARRASDGPLALVPVRRGELHVTEGALRPGPGDFWRVEAPRFRAVLDRRTPPRAEVRFRYLGPTRRELPLASGRMRRQVALKLRAQDGCNVLYVGWRFAPKDEVVVQLKRNPGRHRSAACGNHGYRTIPPIRTEPAPDIDVGQTHALEARLVGAILEVTIDGHQAWRGEVGPDALSFDGPVGLRTDNARIAFSFRAPAPHSQQPRR